MSSNIHSTPHFVSGDSNSSSNLPLVTINTSSQIPYKLTASNYPFWHATFTTILFGYDLMGYLDGTLPCPLIPIEKSSPSALPRYAHCRDAWQHLAHLFVSKSQARIMQLKEDLTLIQQGSCTMSEFLHAVKVIVDELSLIDAPVSDDDLTLYVLNGLGLEFRDMVVPIRTRETGLSFAELHDLLIGHEHYIKRMDNNASALVSRPAMNCATSTNNKWLLDFAASHNITSNLANLSIHSEYEGQAEVVLGDVYLINRLPTPLLSYTSPFETFFGRTPNYHKLWTFSCQCYPWLVPYRTNKLQAKSKPCVFLGYSLTQHAFKCLDLHTGKLYLSRHVTFDEHLFPFKNAPPHVQVLVPATFPTIFSSPSPVPLVRLIASDGSPHTPLAQIVCAILISSTHGRTAQN
ncbi:Retrovirus-related Pol polyprotein from transposon RE1 [Vitis vinifera]|uniref:Retrovirus-related Pol polyprotein from transposon RE1 n=1 Tax=Vitis vinifera TaxID=29760 RepID=A0A438JH72_VITVI|nr:Retrovirus-related Pol polyprotein from transposon RE1 [Vitis vinifera]